MKRMNWLLGSVLALLLVPTHSSAQNVCDSISEDDIIIDSVYTETGEIVADTFRLGERKKEIPQYEIKEHDWVDLCANPKYAVVTKGGKQGIYDMILHQNITEIEFDELGFYRQREEMQSFDEIPDEIVLDAVVIDGESLWQCVCRLGHLRHHAIHQQRCADHLHGYGCKHGCCASGGRQGRQA